MPGSGLPGLLARRSLDMPVDPADRIERILSRWIEEDRRERRLKRAQKKARTLSEADKRREEWLHRWKKEIEEWENRKRAEGTSDI